MYEFECPSPFCFTSTEARWLIRDGDRWEGARGGGGGRKSEGSTADTARKRPAERPWTAARTMEVLRRCPLAIAQRLVHCAIAVSTAVTYLLTSLFLMSSDVR